MNKKSNKLINARYHKNRKPYILSLFYFFGITFFIFWGLVEGLSINSHFEILIYCM